MTGICVQKTIGDRTPILLRDEGRRMKRAHAQQNIRGNDELAGKRDADEKADAICREEEQQPRWARRRTRSFVDPQTNMIENEVAANSHLATIRLVTVTNAWDYRASPAKTLCAPV